MALSFQEASSTLESNMQRTALARQWEGTGRIINEFYSKSEYKHRRVHFLSNHQDYRERQDLFEIAQYDADAIFEPENGTLSSQVVRGHELASDLDPLLPFSTSDNTQTIDDFASYTDAEWIPPASLSHQDEQTANDLSADPDSAISQVISRTLTSMAQDRCSLAEPRLGPPMYTATDGVSSLRERPISIPVKTQGGTKRPADNAVAENNESPQKRAKSAPPAAPTSTASSPPAKKESPTRLQRIADGEILPKSRAEATAAQALRRDKLSQATAEDAMGMLPEFWSLASVSRREMRDGPVRCLCGAVTVDEGHQEEWIGCDGEECGGSWQHVSCAGEAVSKDKEAREKDDYVYHCQMCDPWRHRKELQKVRAGMKQEKP